MFEGDKETFAQAIRNECMCGPDGDLSDWDRTWNEMWQSISQQETCPDKESVEALLEVMLDTRYETDDMDEERSEYLSGLIDRWRSDKEAKQEAVDTISAEVFDDVVVSANVSRPGIGDESPILHFNTSADPVAADCLSF